MVLCGCCICVLCVWWCVHVCVLYVMYGVCCVCYIVCSMHVVLYIVCVCECGMCMYNVV